MKTSVLHYYSLSKTPETSVLYYYGLYGIHLFVYQEPFPTTYNVSHRQADH